MPNFNAEVPHALSQEEAVERLKGFLTGVEARFADLVKDVSGEWTDNVLSFSFTSVGMTISGELIVLEEFAKVEGQLPFAAAMFRGKIETDIAKELQRALS